MGTLSNLRPRSWIWDHPVTGDPAVFHGPIENYDLSCTLPVSVWGDVLALLDADPALAALVRAAIGRHNPAAVIVTDPDPTPARGIGRPSRGGAL